MIDYIFFIIKCIDVIRTAWILILHDHLQELVAFVEHNNLILQFPLRFILNNILLLVMDYSLKLLRVLPFILQREFLLNQSRLRRRISVVIREEIRNPLHFLRLASPRLFNPILMSFNHFLFFLQLPSLQINQLQLLT